MKGKVVIVTGGSSGMGKAMAQRFANEGAKVVITGRNKEKLDNTIKEFAENQENILAVQMDVRNVEDVKRTIEETVNRFGTIDYLINNAAGNFICPAEDLSPNGWKSVIDIVLNGTFYCSSLIGKYWIENGIKGSIINMVAIQ